jgi:hypothetical protein
MPFPQWAKVSLAAFLGKVAGALFIAVCVLIGFGPDQWAAYVVKGSVFTPVVLRSLLLLLGGIVALVLLAPVFRKILKTPNLRALPISERNLMAYMRSDATVMRLDEAIAHTARLPLDSEGSSAWPVLEEALLFGVSTIGQLHRLLLENEDSVIRMSHYSYPTKSIARGHCLLYLFEVLGAQLGQEKFKEYRNLLQYSGGGTDNQLASFREISLSGHRWWRRKTNVPLTDDFNLIPIEPALSMAFHQTRHSAFAKSLAGKSKRDALIAYFEYLKGKVWLYGSPKGTENRRPMPHMSFIKNPRFENTNLIVDCQVASLDKNLHPISNTSIYERLYVLRPTLLHAIGQLIATKT